MKDLKTLVMDYKREWERNRDVLGPETDALVAARDALFAAVGDVDREDRDEVDREDQPPAVGSAG